MFQPFWLADGFVTGYNHLFKKSNSGLKNTSDQFLSPINICYELTLSYIIKGYWLWPLGLWADKTIRQANSESEEIIGSSSCPETAIRVELDNLPLVTWIDLLTPSIVLEEPSKLFNLPRENNRSVSDIASSNNSD